MYFPVGWLIAQDPTVLDRMDDRLKKITVWILYLRTYVLNEQLAALAIDDIVNIVHSSIRIFADDTTLFISVDSANAGQTFSMLTYRK